MLLSISCLLTYINCYPNQIELDKCSLQTDILLNTAEEKIRNENIDIPAFYISAKELFTRPSGNNPAHPCNPENLQFEGYDVDEMIREAGNLAEQRVRDKAKEYDEDFGELFNLMVEISDTLAEINYKTLKKERVDGMNPIRRNIRKMNLTRHLRKKWKRRNMKI